MICKCLKPGFCETFKRIQPARNFQICRGEVLTPEACEVYRKNWEAMASGRQSPPPPNAVLSDREIAEIFSGEDPTLLGNRIKAMTDALGIPPCGGCEVRKKWINDAHQWWRSVGRNTFTQQTSPG